jgi:hypothetical protein
MARRLLANTQMLHESELDLCRSYRALGISVGR